MRRKVFFILFVVLVIIGVGLIIYSPEENEIEPVIFEDLGRVDREIASKILGIDYDDSYHRIIYTTWKGDSVSYNYTRLHFESGTTISVTNSSLDYWGPLTDGFESAWTYEFHETPIYSIYHLIGINSIHMTDQALRALN